MSDKKKRLLTVAGGCIIALVLIIAIAGQFYIAPKEEDILPSSGVTGIEVPEPDVNVPDKTEKETDILPNDIEPSTEEDTVQPQTDQPLQKLQPDVTKPEAPEKPQVIDESDTQNPEKPPEYKTDDTEKKPAESTPQGGEKKDGKIYVPGFGWQTPTGGSGSTADDMYENGNKIGEMN